MILDTDLPNEPTQDAIRLAVNVLLANGYTRGFRGALMLPDGEEWLTVGEAAEVEDAPHKRTLKRWCEKGKLESVKYAVSRQKQYYINPDSLTRHIANERELLSEVDALTDGGLNDPSEGWLHGRY